MTTSRTHRFLRGATQVAALTIAITPLACARDQSTSPQAAVHATSATFRTRANHDRVSQARIAKIRQRAADVQRRGLRADERARVSALSSQFSWVGDIHHAAMQEGIGDESLRPARNERAVPLRCDAQVRYLTKYSSLIEARTGARFSSDDDRRRAMQSFATRIGDCAPSSMPHAMWPRPAAESRPRGGAVVRADSISGRWAEYVASITAGLRTAKSLEDARAMIGAHVAVATADDSLSSVGLDIVAAIAELTTSSALEWDTYFKPPEASLFLWGWLSSIGEYLIGIVIGDAEGCIAGVDATLAELQGVIWAGTPENFINMMSAACTAGGIVGSLLAAI